jgi:type I restriction enzyme, S subunit
MMKKDWRKDKLKDLCEDIFSGGTPDTRKSEYWGGNINWLSSGETRNIFINNTEKTITKEGVKNSSTRLAQKWDLVMACAGQGHTRGQVSLCLIDTYVNQSILVIRTNKNILSPSFLFYTLSSKYQFLRDFSSSNSIRGSITCPMLGSLDINYPEMEDQDKISQILINYDYLIENNTKRIKLLEKIAKLIYEEWFVKFKFPGHEKAKFIDSELGKIPEGWEVCKVGGLIKRLKAGKKFTQNNVFEKGFIPVVDQSTKEILGYHNEEADHLATSNNPIMVFGDHTCKMKILTKSFSVGPNVIPFKALNRPESFIYYMINSLVNTREYKRHWNVLCSKKAIIPSLEITNLFNEKIIIILNHLSLLKEKNINLSKTRDLLLPRLITGKVDVSELDIQVEVKA